MEKIIITYLKICTLILLPCLFIKIINFFKVDYFVEIIQTNINVKFLQVLIIEIYLIFGLFLWIVLIISITTAIIHLFYKVSIIEFIKNLFLKLSLKNYLLSMKLKEKKNIISSDLCALFSISSYFFIIITTGDLLYKTLITPVSKVMKEIIEKTPILKFDTNLISGIIMIIFSIILFVLLMYYSLITIILIIEYKNFVIIIGLIIFNVFYKNFWTLIIYFSFFLILIYIPLRKRKYIHTLEYISSFQKFLSKTMIKNEKELILEIFKFLIFSFLVTNILFFFINGNNIIIIFGCYIFSLILTINMYIYTREEKIVFKILSYIFSIIISLSSFFTLKIFDEKFNIKTTSEFLSVFAICYLFLDKIIKLLKEICEFIQEKDLLYLYENYSISEIKKKKLPLEKIGKLKENLEIEKQFIYYLKLNDQKFEKIFDIYENTDIKENKEFIYFLYLKYKGKKFNSVKNKYNDIKTGYYEKVYNIYI